MKPDTVASIIRWIARAWSIASIALVLLILVGEWLFPHAPPPSSVRDLVLMFLFPFSTFVGMVLAWRWELLGGGITVGSLVAFYMALRAMDGQFPGGPYFALVAAPGLFFLLSWVITVARKRNSQA